MRNKQIDGQISIFDYLQEKSTIPAIGDTVYSANVGIVRRLVVYKIIELPSGTRICGSDGKQGWDVSNWFETESEARESRYFKCC